MSAGRGDGPAGDGRMQVGRGGCLFVSGGGGQEPQVRTQHREEGSVCACSGGGGDRKWVTRGAV